MDVQLRIYMEWKYMESTYMEIYGKKEGIQGERIEQEDLGSSAHLHFFVTLQISPTQRVLIK